MISQWWTGPNGKTITDLGTLIGLVQNGLSANARRGYAQCTTYQPAIRYWHFQFIEGGWVLTLSLLLLAATSWLVRRRAA